MSKFWFDFSMLDWILSIYYLAKRITGNLLNNGDVIGCGTLGENLGKHFKLAKLALMPFGEEVC